jgi:hypothetical protein
MDADQPEYLPQDSANDELVQASIKLEDISFAFPYDNEHTQIGINGGSMKIKTDYLAVSALMQEASNSR